MKSKFVQFDVQDLLTKVSLITHVLDDLCEGNPAYSYLVVGIVKKFMEEVIKRQNITEKQMEYLKKEVDKLVEKIEVEWVNEETIPGYG